MTFTQMMTIALSLVAGLTGIFSLVINWRIHKNVSQKSQSDSVLTDIENLRKKALGGDAFARAQIIVDGWNRVNKAGTEIFYLKSKLEGKCRLKTAGCAYFLGESDPVVPLKGIGVVLLDKVELTLGR